MIGDWLGDRSSSYGANTIIGLPWTRAALL
jgi:hypothetical protein